MARPNVRGAMLLAVVVLGVLLVTPDLCQAHVRTRYRADYKAKLADLKELFNAQALHYDNLKQGALDTVDDMTPLVGDPDKHDELLAEEEWAHDVWLTIAPIPKAYTKEWNEMALAFRNRAALYFAKRAQQEEFKYQAAFMKMAGELLASQAMEHIVDAYWWLGGDPPDLAYVTGTAIPEGDDDAALAHEEFEVKTGKLSKML